MKIKGNIILIIAFVVLLIGALIQSRVLPFGKTNKVSTEELKTRISNYFQSQNIQNFEVLEIQDDEQSEGLYKIKLRVNNQPYDSYATKDGSKLFGAAIDLTGDQSSVAAGNTSNPQPGEVSVKSDKPVVELFVMSHCPYGTQVEKGMLPVIKTLGDKIDFNLRFVYYAMHGQVEVDEQTNQYCIEKNEPEKFVSYLDCFLEEGNGEGCLTENEIDTARLDQCAQDADKEYNITSNFENEDTWLSGRYPLFDVHKDLNDEYSVQGSPTLIINGTEVSSSRDSASLLATVCSGFTQPPEECNTELSTEPPSAGFGYNTGSPGPATDGSCE